MPCWPAGSGTRQLLGRACPPRATGRQHTSAALALSHLPRPALRTPLVPHVGAPSINRVLPSIGSPFLAFALWCLPSKAWSVFRHRPVAVCRSDARTAPLTDGPALDLPVPKHAGAPADIPDTYDHIISKAKLMILNNLIYARLDLVCSLFR